jgi:uncharacterized protein YqjF (DUF2071 family)
MVDRICLRPASPSQRAMARMQRARGEPMFVADWDRVLMIHFSVDAKQLQHDVPFELDLWDGHAFVSLVAFTMRGMRPAFGGRLTSWVFRPLATHDFLNMRTYVRKGRDTGIHFLAEWVSSRLALALGPGTFSLPYRLGKIDYHNDWRLGVLSGCVEDAATDVVFSYQAELDTSAGFSECRPGSLDEWLMERYSAFNSARDRKKYFWVWHEPWRQCKARVDITNATSLVENWNWFAQAELIGANYSPGNQGVWLGRPRGIKSLCQSSC